MKLITLTPPSLRITPPLSTLNSNNLEGNSEDCFKEIKNKIWTTPTIRDLTKEKTNLALYWDKDNSIIYGLRLTDSVFDTKLYIEVGKISSKTHNEMQFSNNYEDFQKLWSTYGEYANPTKILTSGQTYSGGRVLYLIDTEKMNFNIYIIDPKIKDIFKIPSYINYEFFCEIRF